MATTLEQLSPLALRVLALRLGIDGAGERDHGQVAVELGCHPRFVRRIEASALATLGSEQWSDLQGAAQVAEDAPPDGA